MPSNALGTQGVVFKRGDGGSPEVFTAVSEIVEFDGPDGTATEIDITHLTSTAKEFLVGLKDEGRITFGMNFVPTDAQQIGLRNDRANRTKRNFRLELTDAGPTKLSFAAYVMGLSISGRPDDKISARLTLRITGDVVYS